MKYYKVILENGEELFLESKQSLSEDDVIAGMIEEATLSPVEADEVIDIDEITEDEYEQYAL